MENLIFVITTFKSEPTTSFSNSEQCTWKNENLRAFVRLKLNYSRILAERKMVAFTYNVLTMYVEMHWQKSYTHIESTLLKYIFLPSILYSVCIHYKYGKIYSAPSDYTQTYSVAMGLTPFR